MDAADGQWTFTVEEVAQKLGISRASAYQGVASGEIPSIRIGRRILIPRIGLEVALRAGGPEQSGGEAPSRARLIRPKSVRSSSGADATRIRQQSRLP